MKFRTVMFGAVMASGVGLPATAMALPTCSQLQTQVQAMPGIVAGSVNTVICNGSNPSTDGCGSPVTVNYCRVNLTYSDGCGTSVSTGGYHGGEDNGAGPN